MDIDAESTKMGSSAASFSPSLPPSLSTSSLPEADGEIATEQNKTTDHAKPTFQATAVPAKLATASTETTEMSAAGSSRCVFVHMYKCPQVRKSRR
jgi:hypothetical protein